MQRCTRGRNVSDCVASEVVSKATACLTLEHPPPVPSIIGQARRARANTATLKIHVISIFLQRLQRRAPCAQNRSSESNKMSNLSDATRLKATVFVGGLDQAVTQQTLFHAFLPFGDIVEVNLPKPDLPNSNETHRGFGYVEFEAATDAADAIDNMDRSELYGQVIKVAAAKPQKDHTEGLGSKTAVWEQVRSRVIFLMFQLLTMHRRAGWRSML
jgi:hypothetical protein